MCVLDTNNDDELRYDEYADKVNQVCNIKGFLSYLSHLKDTVYSKIN